MAFKKRRPWEFQPQEVAVVRPELNPLIGLNPGVSYHRAIDGRDLTVGSGFSPGRNRFGREVVSAATGNISRTVSLPVQYPYTLVAIARPEGIGALQTVASLSNASDKTVRVFLGTSGEVRGQQIGATTFTTAITGQVTFFGQPCVMVVVFDSQSSIRAYGLGPFAESSAVATTDVGAMSAHTIASFAQYSGSAANSPLSGSINLAQWLNYAPTEQEARQWLRNPWLIFEPLSIPVGFTAAGGGGTTITGVLGTAVASGFTAGINANRTIAASLGTATASGFQATVANSTDTTVNGALGTVVASGFTANVNANRTIAGALGTVAASGFQAGVSNTNDTVISGSLGTVSAIGYKANIDVNRTITAALGAAQALGFGATVQNGDAPDPVDTEEPVSYATPRKREYHYDWSHAPVSDSPIAKALTKAVEVKAKKEGVKREDVERTLRRVVDLGEAQELVARQLQDEAAQIETDRQAQQAKAMFAAELQAAQDFEDEQIAQVVAMLL